MTWGPDRGAYINVAEWSCENVTDWLRGKCRFSSQLGQQHRSTRVYVKSPAHIAYFPLPSFHDLSNPLQVLTNVFYLMLDFSSITT